MKKPAIFIFVLLLCSITINAQQAITEENYLKADSMIWAELQIKIEPIITRLQAYPQEEEKLYQEYLKESDIASKKNLETAIKYAAVPSGLQRIFMLRNELSKEDLSQILAGIPQEMRESPYGQSIQAHIETKQIEEGDNLFKFRCIGLNGEPFEWSTVKNKQVLLLYGGLGCIGPDGRAYLEKLYNETSRADFDIMVYWPVSSLEGLRKINEELPSEYITVSDFEEDHSIMKITYGVQATPTCFLIDKDGIVKVVSLGLDPKRFDEFIIRNI